MVAPLKLKRSLITLKALTFAPTRRHGSHNSLPENIGGTHNWDYRFCWVRDATLTLLALVRTRLLDSKSMARLG